ncbi:MAG: hypothetical protein VX938_12365, partial [Myxococcota bacterium]|nr:hypothetical protein [Myxococcota bacterium]
TEEVRRLAGRFAAHTRATGLTGPDDRPVAGRVRVLRAALMDRWCRGVVQRRPPAGLLSREERELLLRWKLAANPLVQPPRRVEIAKELRQMESAYPVVQALAARAASEGQLPVALQLYRAALEERPGDRLLQANIDHLARSVETGESP